MPTGLLLIHAFPLDASMWQPQVEGLGIDMPIVAPNFPGFGGTSTAGDTTTMDAMADVCADALKSAGVDRAIVCGLSMGGYAALALLRKHPGMVAGLVLANTRAGADDEAGKTRRADLAARLRAEGSDFLVASPPPLLSADAPAALTDQVKGIIAAQPAESIAAASLGMAARADSNDLLAGITVPTLVITSSADALIPPAATKDTADQIPNVEFKTIEGAGHLSNLEASDAFNALLREFIAAHTW